LRDYLSITTFYNFEKIKESVGKTFFKKLEYNGWGFTQLCVGFVSGKIALKPVLGVWFYLKFF
jgi:hypothetical protein